MLFLLKYRMLRIKTPMDQYKLSMNNGKEHMSHIVVGSMSDLHIHTDFYLNLKPRILWCRTPGIIHHWQKYTLYPADINQNKFLGKKTD